MAEQGQQYVDQEPHEMQAARPHQLFDYPAALEHKRELLGVDRVCLVKHSILPKDELKVKGPVEPVDKHEARAIGALLGLVHGDALGAPLEFSPVRYGSKELKGIKASKKLWKEKFYNRFRLKPGQWTDDASMALCLADSLLTHQQFDPCDLRLRFLYWWDHGYNNAFGFDDPQRPSVGLGGNIGASLEEFQRPRPWIPYDQRQATTAGDIFTSGNGSIMRLAPVPIRFALGGDVGAAKSVAWHQSKTTHQGHEAGHCACLATHVMMTAIRDPADDPAVVKQNALGNIEFTPFTEEHAYSIKCLAQSKDEEEDQAHHLVRIDDRKWNWKSEDYTFCESRAKAQPGYIGSYSMDGLAMALHCVWTTDSYAAAVLKAANMRGDADTVGAITGQIAGAVYGVGAIPKEDVKLIHKWDPYCTIEKRARRLYRNQFLPPDSH